MSHDVRRLRRRNRRRRRVRRSAASKAIEKTGNWQKILRERIEGLSWRSMADKGRRKLCLGLAGPGRLGGHAGGE